MENNVYKTCDNESLIRLYYEMKKENQTSKWQFYHLCDELIKRIENKTLDIQTEKAKIKTKVK